LVGSRSGFSRCAHFKYMKMPGGEAAVREPWRMIFGMMHEHIGDKIFEMQFDFLKGKTVQELEFLKRAIDQNINTPLTSSCGRLFDAISSLLGLVHVVNYEAEAAIKLEETAAQVEEGGSYGFDVQGKDVYIIGLGEMFDGLVGDMAARMPPERIARKFHNSMATLIVEMARRLKAESGLDTVVLSGGVFQNRLLYESASRLLREEGFTLLEGRDVPLNDLGICVGQTFVALNGT
ncbi:MAG: carbamoyltransferase HypF, partial [bacterium]